MEKTQTCKEINNVLTYEHISEIVVSPGKYFLPNKCRDDGITQDIFIWRKTEAVNRDKHGMTE